jgi:hypothetical protein
MNTIAHWILRLACRLMPPERRGWAEAMRSESAYLPPGAALRWSLGCLLAAFTERFAPMKTGDFRISRWVMSIETLGCFGFLTLAWFEITFGASGLVRHDWDIVTNNYATYPGGIFIFSMIVLGSIVGLVGPVGLFLGLRYVSSGRALTNRVLGFALLAALLVYMLAGIAGYFIGPPDFHSQPGFTLLVIVLPAAGIAHLMHLARPVRPGAPTGGSPAAA